MRRSLLCPMFAAALLCACSLGAQNAPAPASAPVYPEVGEAITRAATVVPVNDRDYYKNVIKLIQGARHSVRVCLYQAWFYDEYPDSDSNRLLDALRDASVRGVDVTAIIDRSDWNQDKDDKNKKTADHLASAGVTVYMDPVAIQSHQKLMIVDRDIVVVASTNWSHYSLNKNKEAGAILFSADAGRRYGQYFAERMADAELYDSPADRTVPTSNAIKPADLGVPAYTATDVEYLDNRWYYVNLAKELRAATKSIDVVQNYAYYYGGSHRRAGDVPNRPAGKPPETDLIAQELVAAQKRGVAVRVVMDYTVDAEFQKDWKDTTLAFARQLSAAGVAVYRDDPKEQIHAKMLVIDDAKVLVGSQNWSFEALEMNNECGVVIDSAELVKSVYRPWVDDIFARSTRFEESLTPAKEKAK